MATVAAFVGDDAAADTRLAADATAEEGQRCHVAAAGGRRHDADDGDVEEVVVDHRRPFGGGVQVAQQGDQGVGHRAVEARRQRHLGARHIYLGIFQFQMDVVRILYFIAFI